MRWRGLVPIALLVCNVMTPLLKPSNSTSTLISLAPFSIVIIALDSLSSFVQTLAETPAGNIVVEVKNECSRSRGPIGYESPPDVRQPSSSIDPTSVNIEEVAMRDGKRLQAHKLFFLIRISFRSGYERNADPVRLWTGKHDDTDVYAWSSPSRGPFLF